jgi:hypothetical protein
MVLKNAVEGSKETHINSNSKKNNTSATSRMEDKSELTTAGKRKRERSESPSDRPEEDEGGNAYIDLLKVP